MYLRPPAPFAEDDLTLKQLRCQSWFIYISAVTSEEVPLLTRHGVAPVAGLVLGRAAAAALAAALAPAAAAAPTARGAAAAAGWGREAAAPGEASSDLCAAGAHSH
mgnify:CR=1 FL=1